MWVLAGRWQIIKYCLAIPFIVILFTSLTLWNSNRLWELAVSLWAWLKRLSLCLSLCFCLDGDTDTELICSLPLGCGQFYQCSLQWSLITSARQQMLGRCLLKSALPIPLALLVSTFLSSTSISNVEENMAHAIKQSHDSLTLVGLGSWAVVWKVNKKVLLFFYVCIYSANLSPPSWRTRRRG